MTTKRSVAMVSQDTYIFMGTVADNIAYANPNATRADIIQAATRDFWMAFSISVSTLAVASSRISILGSARIARAIEIRCFSPPDRSFPEAPKMAEEFKIEQMEKEVEEMTALRYLTKENAVFQRTDRRKRMCYRKLC